MYYKSRLHHSNHFLSAMLFLAHPTAFSFVKVGTNNGLAPAFELLTCALYSIQTLPTYKLDNILWDLLCFQFDDDTK